VRDISSEGEKYRCNLKIILGLVSSLRATLIERVKTGSDSERSTLIMHKVVPITLQSEIN